MKISHSPIFYDSGCAVALGTFDGVHIGHSAVINAALQFGLPVVVVTTADNPHGLKKILPDSICRQKFEALGVDAIVYFEFNKIKNLSDENYLDMLRDKFNAKVFCCGYNYKFGKGACGNVDTIKYYVNQSKLTCSITEQVPGASSTNIRKLLNNGDIKSANSLLGSNYCFDFEVEKGAQIGRTLGFPTINQVYPDNFCLPKFGVYKSVTYINDKKYPSITNIGIKPTVKIEIPRAETHIIDYSGDLYGQNIKVELLEFLREEKQFSSLEELKKQIEKDKNR